MLNEFVDWLDLTYPCNVSGSRFKRKETLNIHMSRIHITIYDEKKVKHRRWHCFNPGKPPDDNIGIELDFIEDSLAAEMKEREEEAEFVKQFEECDERCQCLKKRTF